MSPTPTQRLAVNTRHGPARAETDLVHRHPLRALPPCISGVSPGQQRSRSRVGMRCVSVACVGVCLAGSRVWT
eukprot:2452849-Rhodomonas_salina.2